jgi:hypothetical protein
MNCPFCEKEMPLFSHNHTSENQIYREWDEYICKNSECWVSPGGFPRYECGISSKGEPVIERYALENVYVTVDIWTNRTHVYKMIAYMLVDELELPCLIWLNAKNKRATLDKLKILIMLS